ncbi:prolyl hydroxylase family protein [Reyranella sp.]|uniref:prolyl hydroxylase family protein n=1 Tax=Reyranella sp. TaxID=1929291 RepID=UPI003D0BDFEA
MTALSLRPGDRVPDFILPGLDGKLRKFIWSFTGRAVALVAVDDLKTVDIEQFAAFAARCKDVRVDIVVAAGMPVAAASAAWTALGGDADGRLLLCDGERKFVPLLLMQGGGVAFGQAGMGLRLRVIVLDANQRVAASFDSRPLLAAAEQIAALAPSVRSDESADQVIRTATAPVLVLPRVFEREFCAQVIRLWEKGDHKDSGVSSRYGTVGMLDLKRTEDYMVVEPMMQKAISDRIAYRIGPELVKVFAYDREFGFDAHVVLSYSADGRHFFGAHRDNGAPTTADRSFAVSLNLNDDFEGGELVFPEYSGIKVCPPAGAAAVFSCSVLHEALPVTRGRRFVLTTFFRTKK